MVGYISLSPNFELGVLLTGKALLTMTIVQDVLSRNQKFDFGLETLGAYFIGVALAFIVKPSGRQH